MATAPDRDGARTRAGQAQRPVRDERPVRMAKPERAMRPSAQVAEKSGIDRTAWSKAVVLLNCVLILVVAIVGIRYTRGGEEADQAVEQPQPAVVTPLPEVSEAAASAEPSTDQVVEQPSVSAEPATDVAVPAVKKKLDTDFAAGDGWPSGADPRAVGGRAWKLGVVNRLLTHGDPSSANAASWMQKWTETDVRRIGARIQFAPNHTGAAVLTAWHTSILDASGSALPETGMRLVATPGSWRLVAVTGSGEAVLGQGTYARGGGTATYDLVRKGDTVWLTDPDGDVTTITDARIARFSGPWATWELREDKATMRPAAFKAIWAG